MDKGLFANDGSFMERFKQMQQEMQDKEKPAAPATTAGAVSSAPAKPVNPKTPLVIAANRRPLEVKKAGSVLSGGKLAFSLKKNKIPIVPVKFGAEEDDDDDVAGVERGDHAKRHKSIDAHSAAAPARVVAYRLTVSTWLGRMLIERVGNMALLLLQ
uniref:Uncharacterized protein n=1 Tax=Triticum urartu TaxID=4572 RepID=A0A8R7QBW4_TRIUA